MSEEGSGLTAVSVIRSGLVVGGLGDRVLGVARWEAAGGSFQARSGLFGG